jgi:hypothetical protein
MDPVANGKPPEVAKDPDLSAFYVERARQHREYVAGCLQLADKVIRALQPRLGPNAKLSVQSLKPSPESPGQTQITPNGILQENGVLVFGYSVAFEAHQMPPYAVHFFLGVGSVGEKGKLDDWYVSHDKESFSMPNGGEGQELEPLFGHIVGALETEIARVYPTDTKQTTTVEPPQLEKKDEKKDTPKPEAPKAKETA